MEKVINGKRYSTETATEVGYSEYGRYGDFDYICETLYRKRSGEYFLHGYGGGNTRYVQYSSHNSFGPGEKIMPMSYSDALEWAEGNLDGKTVAEEFGISDDDGTEQIRATVPARLADAARKTAAKNGISLSQYIEQILNDSL